MSSLDQENLERLVGDLRDLLESSPEDEQEFWGLCIGRAACGPWSPLRMLRKGSVGYGNWRFFDSDLKVHVMSNKIHQLCFLFPKGEIINWMSV